MTDLKNPPLAKTLRKFLAAIRLNPPRKRHKNGRDVTETDVRTMMLVLHSLAWHASGVKEGATTINCDPSLKQIAELAHVSPRTCQYAIKELESQNIITVKRRGHHTSNVFTIHRLPISDTQHGCTPEDDLLEAIRDATEKVRPATEPPQACNETIQTCNMVASSGVDLQDSKSSGVVAQGRGTESKSKPDALFLKSQSQNHEPKLTREQLLVRHDEAVLAWMREHGREAEIPKLKEQMLESRRQAEKQRPALEASLAEELRRLKSPRRPRVMTKTIGRTSNGEEGCVF